MKRTFSILLSCSIVLGSFGTYAAGSSTNNSPKSSTEFSQMARGDISNVNFDSELYKEETIPLRGVNLNFNGSNISSDFPSVIYNYKDESRTMVPLRVISENLGAEVKWHTEDKGMGISIELDDKVIYLNINSSMVKINGSAKPITEGVPPKLMKLAEDVNYTTMVPLRFISEELGATVDWDQSSFTALVKSESKHLESLNKLNDIKLENINGKKAFVLYGDQPFSLKKKFSLTKPNRLVLDIDNSLLNTSTNFNMNTDTVSAVRTSQSNLYGEDSVVRVVFEMDSNVTDYSYTLEDHSNRLVIYIEGESSTGDLPQNPLEEDDSSQNPSIDEEDVPDDNLGYDNGGDYKQDSTVYTDYSISLNDMVSRQSKRYAVTDRYRNKSAYVYEKDLIDPNSVILQKTDDDIDLLETTTVDFSSIKSNIREVKVDSTPVRENPNLLSFEYGKLRKGARVNVVDKVGDWVEIKYGSFRNAKPEDIEFFLNPDNFVNDSTSKFQFLDLSRSSGVEASDLNKNILSNKGVLTNLGNSFIEAGNRYNINEIYLVSHALLETGNGRSSLATGVLVDSVEGKDVEPRKVYNMFGIGAVDSAPLKLGAERAYKEGWFTPEKAIVGGAKFISEKYVNRPNNNQNTIYEMRWNPDPIGNIHHQYATDIGWAFKQTSNIKKLYDLCDSYSLKFDIPNYKK